MQIEPSVVARITSPFRIREEEHITGFLNDIEKNGFPNELTLIPSSFELMTSLCKKLNQHREKTQIQKENLEKMKILRVDCSNLEIKNASSQKELNNSLPSLFSVVRYFEVKHFELIMPFVLESVRTESELKNEETQTENGEAFTTTSLRHPLRWNRSFEEFGVLFYRGSGDPVHLPMFNPGIFIHLQKSSVETFILRSDLRSSSIRRSESTPELKENASTRDFREALIKRHSASTTNGSSSSSLQAKQPLITQLLPPTLRHLDLSNCSLSALEACELIQYLSDPLNLPRLESLSLKGNHLCRDTHQGPMKNDTLDPSSSVQRLIFLLHQLLDKRLDSGSRFTSLSLETAQFNAVEDHLEVQRLCDRLKQLNKQRPLTPITPQAVYSNSTQSQPLIFSSTYLKEKTGHYFSETQTTHILVTLPVYTETADPHPSTSSYGLNGFQTSSS